MILLRGIGKGGPLVTAGIGFGFVLAAIQPGLAFLSDIQRDPLLESHLFAAALLAGSAPAVTATDLDADPTAADASAGTTLTDAASATTTNETS